MTNVIVAIAIATSIQADAKYAVAERQQHVIHPPIVQYSAVKVDDAMAKQGARVIDTSNVYSGHREAQAFCSGDWK